MIIPPRTTEVLDDTVESALLRRGRHIQMIERPSGAATGDPCEAGRPSLRDILTIA